MQIQNQNHLVKLASQREREKDLKERREIEYQVAVEAGKKRLEEMLIRHILKVGKCLTLYTATSWWKEYYKHNISPSAESFN